MYRRLGGKIKTLAMVICIVEMVMFGLWGIGLIIMGVSQVGSYYFSVGEMVGTIVGGLLLMAFGALVAWLSNFLLAGFGEMVENTEKLQEDTQVLIERANVQQNAAAMLLNRDMPTLMELLAEQNATLKRIEHALSAQEDLNTTNRTTM